MGLQRSAALAAALATIACGRFGFDSDDPADAAIDSPPPIEIPPFDPPTEIAVLNSTSIDDDVTLTADGLVIFFNSARSGNQEIWTSSRGALDQPWSPPALVTELNSATDESTTAISSDGLTILFASDRGGANLHDVYLATRPARSSAFSPPVLLDELNSVAGDFASYISSDRLTAVIHSNRGGQGFDLYTSSRAIASDPFSEPRPLAEINTVDGEVGGRLVSDGVVLTFGSARNGQPDLFFATRPTTSEPFGPTMPFADFNTDLIQEDLWLSDDLCYAVFASETSEGERNIVESRCRP